MDPSFSRSRKGNSYWTKWREIRENTEHQMGAVRELLQKRKSNAIIDAANCKGNIANDSSNEATKLEEIYLPKKLLRSTRGAAQILQENNSPCTSTAINPESSQLFNLTSAANNSVSYENKEILLSSSDENDIPDVLQHFFNETVADTNGDYETFGLNNSSSDEYDETNIHNLPGIEDLKEELAKWSVKFNITQVSLNHLLQILKPFFKDLPCDPRSLLSTPRKYKIKTITNGSYFHFGIEKYIVRTIQSGYNVQNNEVCISVNIDGVPLFKSSKIQLWPILGLINDVPNSDPFTIGVFCGDSKPGNVNEFLDDFVGEMKSLYQNGLQVGGRTVSVKVKCFICDAPARAYLKQTKGHNAYHGCERCTQHGVWLNKVTFPDCSASLRTDEDFAMKRDIDHHGPTKSPLQKLPVGLVSQFVLDPMHLIYLGVVRRLLWLWIKAPVNSSGRIGSIQVRAISGCLVNFQRFIPREFVRKCRSLYEMERWKATELRQFLLYSGIVAVRKHLSPQAYEHFLLLHVAVFSLSSPDLYKRFSGYANQLLHGFVSHFGSLYGNSMLVYNVHNLIHIATDVERYGPLDTFSAFKFESFLGRLKRLMRKPNQPLSQLIRRLAESEANAMHVKMHAKHEKIEPKKKHTMGPLPFSHYAHCQFTAVTYKGLFYSINAPDNCVKIGKNICIIRNILCKEGEEVKFVCETYNKVESFFTYPLCSSKLGIYEVSHVSGHVSICPITDIKCKYVRLPHQQNFVVIPLLNFS